MTNVILLIGPPGAGKSSLGGYIAKKHIGYKFINTGEHLRKKGLLDKVEDMEQLRCEAASFLKEQLLASARGDNILLEFVKETEDAYCLIEILKQHGANLVQVILMPDRGSIQTFNDPQLSMLRDVERKVLERTNKWKENVGRLIEFFSSTNALFILHNKHLQSPLKSLVTSTKAPNFVTDKMLPRKDSNLKHIHWMVSPRLLLTKTTCDFDTGLKTLDFALPRAVIRNEADLTWVNTDQYSVAHKCDGTRYFLIVGATGAHVFKNRVGFAYEFPLTNESIPPKTILDGELVWDDTKGIFFAFDALVVAGKPTWGLPLRMRVDELRKIIVSDDSTTSIIGRPKTLHRQRAPSEDSEVTVVCKRGFESLSEAMESQPTFPTDGFVFSPNSMPYVAQGLLTFKWQPANTRACDIRDEGNLGLIFECVWKNKKWEPVALRLDKKAPSTGAEKFKINYEDGHGIHKNEIKEILEGPKTLDRILHMELPKLPKLKGIQRAALTKHECMELVKNGLVERSFVPELGLEIFNRNKDSKQVPCRGMVFEGEKLVASSFESFDHFGSQRVFDASEWINASIKFDGTLIIAFVHQGKVRVSTRRRMDSEQAIWAQRWIEENANIDAFLEGWTYAFEAIYSDNTVIIPYNFEGLVFLDAWSPDGMSTAPHERPILSAKLGATMCTPSMVLRKRDLLSMLRSKSESALMEGWVIEQSYGRSKLVLESYKSAARINLSPLQVWHDVKMGWDGKKRIANEPIHFRKERMLMLKALEKAFDEEKGKLDFEFDANATWESGCEDAVFIADNKSPSCLKGNQVVSEYNKNGIMMDRMFLRLGFDQPSSLSMFYSPSKYFSLLRVELIDRIRPSDNGIMLHYTPSSNFAQTFAKGWKTPTKKQEEPLIFSLDQVFGVIFSFIEVKTDYWREMCIFDVKLVCKQWRNMINQDKEIQQRIAARRSEKIQRRIAHLLSRTEESDDSDDGYFHHHYDGDRGYGSN